MSASNQIYESAWSDRWSLAGSATTSAQLMSGHSLKLTRPHDAVSPSIRSAMSAGSILPVVEISTPSGHATLVNAKIVKIARPATTRGYVDIFSWQFGAGETTVPGGGKGGRGKAGSLNELEEITIAFEQINMTRKLGKGFKDDWG